MKSYTDLNQSRKLAEILPHKSADMAWYSSYAKDGYSIRMLNETYPLDIIGEEHDEIPAWSLSALLDIYPMLVGRDMGTYCCWQNSKHLYTKHYDNPVDACYEMILNLHEQKLL